MSDPDPSRIFVTRVLPGDGYAHLLADPVFDVDAWPDVDAPPREALLEHVAGVDGLISLVSDRIDEDLLDAAGPQLKVVATVAAGVDNIDLTACRAQGVRVGNTPGIPTQSTADLAMALLLAAARRIPEAMTYVRDGEWTGYRPEQVSGVDIHRATLGIVGLGAIGQAVARRARGFDMRILYWSRAEKPAVAAELSAEYRPLNELLAESDFVTLHVALNPDTHHLIDAAALDRMKPSAILVNAARGPVVDETALAHALENSGIRAAAIDVTEQEPIAVDSALLRLPNAIVLPHVSSSTVATRSEMSDVAVANLRAALAGEPLLSEVGA